VTGVEQDKLDALIEAVLQELTAAGALAGRQPPAAASAAGEPAGAAHAPPPGALTIDVPDPTEKERRHAPHVPNPANPDALAGLLAATTARIAVGRAGPRYRTNALLLFQGDHAITQDALMRDVDPALLEELGLFGVQTQITGGKQEYLLRPDLGRQLSDEARRTVAERCAPGANVQVAVGDGLSARAVEANLRQILPVIRQGCAAAGLSFGTPFFIKYCRVGVLNDIGDILRPDVVVLLIGERPGLGRADSLSAYMAYRPKAGDTDADRDALCNIYEDGGLNPLEAGAYVVRQALRMREHGASGVKLRMKE
jgi:ethanolamine ammonia-lyase small subunit